MSTLGLVQLLFVALAIVMVGLGLSLTPADFTRLLTAKRAVAVAIGWQTLLLPAFAFLTAVLFSLHPPYAVGLMLLAAVPGSISSNLYSNVFGGSVALTVSLTGINTLLSMVTMPLVCSWSLHRFAGGGAHAVPDVAAKLLEVMVLLTVPVAAGMVVRARAPAFARRAERPMRLASLLVLASFSVAAVVKEWSALTTGFGSVGLSVLLFNAVAVALGYGGSLRLGLSRSEALAVAFHLSVRSTVLAIYVAMTVLDNLQIALPAAVYSVTMIVLGLAFGFWARRARPQPAGGGQATQAP